MASPQSSDKLLSNLAITQYDFDPDADTAVDVAWVDMRDFENFAFSFFRTVGTSALDTVKILANADSAGGGTDVEIKTWTNAAFGDPDAVGDYAFGECTAEEIAQEASDAGIANVRYVSVQLEFATSTDEAVVTYVRGGAKRAYDGLSANSIA